MKKNAANGKNFQFSEEEQKAFEIVKNITQDDLLDCWDYGEKEFKAIQIILNLIEKQQKEIEELKENSISKEVIKKEIKKLNEKNGISFDMHTGQILKTKEDYQIAILKKLLRRKL